MNIITILIAAIVLMYLFGCLSKKEHFETNTTVTIRTTDGKYLTVLPNKALAITNDPKSKGIFSVMKFNDTVIALSSQDGRYISACFGDKCSDSITVDNHNPYGANAKLTLIKNPPNKSDSSYKITFYDGKFMKLDIDGSITKTRDKTKSLDVFIENVIS
jgi:hypothetical protein